MSTNGRPGDELPNDGDRLENWLEEFSRMADRALGDGSACDQVHPIMERWYVEWLERDPEPPRSAILQAMACLTTEILNAAPQPLLDALMECDEDEVIDWLQHILATGMALQSSLDRGELDDL